MIISVNWLKKYTDIDVSIDELTELIGARLVEIEGVESLADKYNDVRIVRVVECGPVPDSDHLNLTKVDDGGVVEGVERDENGLVQVVCGAPNVHAGMLAAWLPPASIVPETFGQAEPFVLGARELRGYLSNGMLASAKELDLYDDHEGIIEVDADVEPGASFASAYELDDYLLDIENKSLTHRPDAFGVVGFAREIAGIQGKTFQTPEWLATTDHQLKGDGSVEAPKIIIDEPELSDRFSGVVLTGANEAASSPLSIQTYLARSGVRPINAVVDVTNFLMLVSGQPLHAFDYDKLLKVSGGVNEIHVRSARAGETLKLLDGRVLELTEDDMVVAAGEVVVSLAGAMGGADTEIDSSTTRIFLECATFNLYKLRAIQMRHGIFTEAITRLTKGVPAPLGIPVLAEASRLIGEFAGAVVASDVTEDYPGKHDAPNIEVSIDRLNAVLGTELSLEEAVETLRNVEIAAETDGDVIRVTVPYWRHDLSIPEDVIEEVGRLRGFDSIRTVLPTRDFTAVRPSEFDTLRAKVRGLLVRAGANEVLTYSFVHGDTMRKAGQNPDEAYRITNSISPELQYYRQSIVPSLLGAVHPNGKAGFDHFALFELNKFHTKRHGLTEEGVPLELDSLGFVLARTKATEGAPFYEVKQYLSYLAESLGIEFVYEPLEAEHDYPVTQPFEAKRSARIWNADKTERVGVIGEFRRSVKTAFKLPEYTAGFEISPRTLLKLVKNAKPRYERLSRFPSVERDVCFQVPEAESKQVFGHVFDEVKKATDNTGISIQLKPHDIYQPENEAVKNITFNLVFTSYEKTLTGEEVNEYMDKIINTVTAATGGKVI